MVGQHVDISTVGDGEDVGGHLRATLASVQLGASCRVYWVPLVGVDSHTEETGVSLWVNMYVIAWWVERDYGAW